MRTNIPFIHLFKTKSAKVFLSKSRLARNAFGVMDVVVTMSALGIVVSLLLPVLQEHREAARRSVCQGRLGDLALDSQVYEMVNARLPMQLGAVGALDFADWINSSSGGYFGHSQYASPMALVASLDSDFDIDPIFFDYTTNLSQMQTRFWELAGWQETAALNLPRFRCPASVIREVKPTEYTLLLNQPVIYETPEEDWIGVIYDPDVEEQYGITNYLGCLGAGAGGFQYEPFDSWRYRGMITSRELRTSDQVALADGLSNTIMYGESIGGRAPNGRRIEQTRQNSWMSGGVTRGRAGTNWMENGTIENPLLGRATRSSVWGFGSSHRDGVNVVKGDGSVQIVSRDIDVVPYYALCGAFDTVDSD